MYFGDWIRTSEIKKTWYVSFSSVHDDFIERLVKALDRNGQVQKISSTCLMIESLEGQKSVVKRIRKVLREGDEALLLYPHHKIIGHMDLNPMDDDI